MMQENDLQNWLLSSKGLFDEVDALRKWSALRSFGEGVVQPVATDEDSYNPNWRRLLLAGSVLSESADTTQQEVALLIAQSALIFGDTPLIRDAGAVVLTQLSNSRAIQLAESRHLIEPQIEERLGITEMILTTRRELESSIVLNEDTVIEGNDLQIDLWGKLRGALWTSATAPTATGKTYLILNWLLSEIEHKRCKLGLFLAPTRALVSELEKELLDLKVHFSIPGLRVASLPISELGDLTAPTVLVFTQERLHLFLNAFRDPPAVDVAVVDEVQKLGDGIRGVILQDAIERVSRTNNSCRFVFLSPHSDNPETLLEDAPKGANVAVVPGGAPTVNQNLIIARQRSFKPREWTLSLVSDLGDNTFGEFRLHDRPAGSTSKRLSYIALALGRNEVGTLVYANGAAEAEKLAQQIYDGLAPKSEESESPVDEELNELADFCRVSIHERFQLVNLVKRGVAFHYGNMPSLLRAEIERLFKSGKIRFLVCTSTLMEGVNLACRTIVVKGPRKGRGAPMSPQDFLEPCWSGGPLGC